MDLELKNKIVLVTGSSKGIGKAISNSFTKEGCKVILNGRTKTTLKNSARSLGKNVDYFVADVSNINKCKKLKEYVLKKYGRLDILVCNVGNGSSVIPGKETHIDWEKMIKINLLSSTNMIETFKETLSKNSGVITCISSIAGIENIGAPISYAVSKSALNSYVKQISKPLAKMQIRINVVAPGNIFFKGSVWEKKMKGNPSKIKKLIKEQIPQNRLGKPEEIGDIVLFLSSPKTAFVTGSVIVADGGQTNSF